MSIPLPRTIHLPIKERKVLIADITRGELVHMNDDAFREQFDTLISYNVRNDGIKQDCLYIKQGQFLNPRSFKGHSMVIDPQRTVVVTWTPVQIHHLQPQQSQHWCQQV